MFRPPHCELLRAPDSLLSLVRWAASHYSKPLMAVTTVTVNQIRAPLPPLRGQQYTTLHSGRWLRLRLGCPTH